MNRAAVRRASWAFCLIVGVLLLVHAAGADPVPMRRIAILIGANDPPPSQAPLRYAHDDAQHMADTLIRVGGFAPGDVHVLLDPARPEIERALTLAREVSTASAGNILLTFYYSGHSDGQSVYPHGDSVSLGDLRTRLGAIGARVLVGILDTCHGGSWTQTKGLTLGPPPNPIDLISVSSEGTALLSSSSGLESAHEAESIRGSFFTHHLIGGLLGSADSNGDGEVTLQEAFDYAKDHTVRDSAMVAPTIQHPSFDVQLRGRQDLVLSQVKRSTSLLKLSESSGPLDVIQLDSGVTVSELAPGTRQALIALPPGRYLVRKVVNGKPYSKEFELAAGGSFSLDEAELEPSAERLALKGGEPKPISEATTLPRGFWELRYAIGVSAGPATAWGTTIHETRPEPLGDGTLKRELTGAGGLSWGITDRLTWTLPLPMFAYRFGDPESFEVVPRIGLTAIGFDPGVFGDLDAGIAFRFRTRDDQSFLVTAAARSQFAARNTVTQDPGTAPTLWRVGGGLGYTWLLQNMVTLSFGATVQGDALLDPHDSSARRSSSSISFGSVQSIGYRPLPLVAVHLSQRFSLDAYAAWEVELRTRAVRDTYLAGFTWNF
jgi:hypothetical protein